MIYQFQIINRKVFELNGVRYNRRFRLNLTGDSTARVTDVHTGSILGEYIQSNVFISGVPLNNWGELEDVIYNFECDCHGDDSGSLRGRYFDDTFDISLE